MHVKHCLPAVLGALPVLAQSSSFNPPEHHNPDPFQPYTIRAENITATVIPYGARLTSLLVPDRDDQLQDVVVGYDDPREYLHDTQTAHTYFGAVVGRYANRIKNGTFTLDGEEYDIPTNEHNGANTLHGGNIGYDQRNWTVSALSDSSVTFTLVDRALQGFPGDVVTHAVFSVDTERSPANPHGRPQLTTQLVSLAMTHSTPIMLSNHIYWNLNGFKQHDVLEDTFLQLPLSPRFVATDGILIPNGTILNADAAYSGSPDFTAGKLVGADIDETTGLCGTGCTGYDNCFIVDRPPAYAGAEDAMVPTVRMNSSTTGISLDVAMNQHAVQIYSCNGQDGHIPVKQSQVERNNGHGAQFVNQYGCVVIEPQGWIDGINHPEWGQLKDQIYSPATAPALNWATYQFGTIQ
ncbi:Aldose 1-epimerase [Aspergillus sp. HF37]|nr:Aldose 1-epimerase [Aspergillus sp. HF37]